MTKALKIAVLRDRYPTRFNTPKNSRHTIRRVPFIPTNKIARRYEGLTIALPVGADLLHFYNRIPAVADAPYIMSFESHLPRYFHDKTSPAFAFMRRRLLNPNCRRLIAMSQFAKNMFLGQHKGLPNYDALANKLEVIYPNALLTDARLEAKVKPLPLKLVFVGAHFGRKGGAVAARAAQIAGERKLPMHFHIVSSLEVGAGVWTDPTSEDFFKPYFEMLKAENVTFDRGLPNGRVLDILRDADFSILTTFSDTFGFSVIESFAAGTPVIATPQGALPEFITDKKNGIMLTLDRDANNEWIQINRHDMGSPAYAEMFRSEIERLAQELVAAVTPYCDNPQNLPPLRREARQTAERMFDSAKTSPYLDDLYERCLAG